MNSNYKMCFDHDFAASYMSRNYAYNMEHSHSHDSYEIYILLEGERHVYIDGLQKKTVPDDILMLKPNVKHRSTGAGPHAGICISFTEEFLDKYFSKQAKRVILSCFEDSIIAVRKDVEARICDIFDRMVADEKMRFAHLAEVCSLISQGRSGGAPELNDDRSAAQEYIRGHYANIRGLDDIAGGLHLSKAYMCRKFRKDTGMTITEYINSVRVEKACELLATADMTVAEISELCGYESHAYFSSTFKRLTGKTPVDFRAAARQSDGSRDNQV